MKKFNIAGTCFPDQHYMVDISERLGKIRSLVDEGAYFCINRGRQYGKTTTLEALSHYLKDEYAVFQISFDDLIKKLDQFPSLTAMFRAILYNGKSISYNYSDREMALATRFGFIKAQEGPVAIHNRIFETYLYNYFVTESEKKEILGNTSTASTSRPATW